MSRVQLAMNVTDLDKAVEFYSKLFATEPAKRKPGYANFAIVDPPLKSVLFEGAEGGTLLRLRGGRHGWHGDEGCAPGPGEGAVRGRRSSGDRCRLLRPGRR